jgi:uncharacterized membrane protein YdbT with pleckstrin-like domain
MMTETEEKNEPKDLATIIEELNEKMLDEAAESSAQAFNVGCIISVFAVATIAILTWVFSHWVSALIALTISSLLATSASALIAMRSREGNLKFTFQKVIQPQIEEILQEYDIDQDEFIIQVYDTLSPESPLAQAFSQPEIEANL